MTGVPEPQQAVNRLTRALVNFWDSGKRILSFHKINNMQPRVRKKSMHRLTTLATQKRPRLHSSSCARAPHANVHAHVHEKSARFFYIKRVDLPTRRQGERWANWPTRSGRAGRCKHRQVQQVGSIDLLGQGKKTKRFSLPEENFRLVENRYCQYVLSVLSLPLLLLLLCVWSWSRPWTICCCSPIATRWNFTYISSFYQPPPYLGCFCLEYCLRRIFEEDACWSCDWMAPVVIVVVR